MIETTAVANQLSSPRTAYCINPDCSRRCSQSLTERQCLYCGTTLRLNDRYIPLALLTETRQAETVRVYDLKAKTERVLKILIDPLPRTVELLQQMAEALAEVRCTGLPRVEPDGYFQVLVKTPQPQWLRCLVMEHIEGISLQDMMRQHPNGCSEAWVIDWLKQGVAALQQLHDRQVIHQNLKPANLLLRRATNQIVLIGVGGNIKPVQPTPTNRYDLPAAVSQSYLPPEQLRGGEVTPAADFFALGQIGIYLLTGQHPVQLKHSKTAKSRWRDSSVGRGGKQVRVSPGLADLLDRMVHSNPGQRPSAAEIMACLKQLSPQTTRLLGSALHPAIPRHRVQPNATARWNQLNQGLGELKHALHVINTAANWFLQSCSLLVLTIVAASLGGAVGSAIGFWLAYYSPIAGSIHHLLSHTIPLGPSTLVTIQPAILVFVLAGYGTVWGLMKNHRLAQLPRPWLPGTIASLGYGLAWLSWQWGSASETTGHAFGRMGTIAALSLALEMGFGRYLLPRLLAAGIGTFLTLTAVIGSNIWKPATLLLLFPFPGEVFRPTSLSPLWEGVIFQILVAAIASFWIQISDNGAER